MVPDISSSPCREGFKVNQKVYGYSHSICAITFEPLGMSWQASYYYTVLAMFTAGRDNWFFL